jgi:hypothetical protein
MCNPEESKHVSYTLPLVVSASLENGRFGASEQSGKLVAMMVRDRCATSREVA